MMHKSLISSTLFFIAEEEFHHHRSGSEEVSAQVCDRSQGKHPAGDPGEDWCVRGDPTVRQQLRNCHPPWGARPPGSGPH